MAAVEEITMLSPISSTLEENGLEGIASCVAIVINEAMRIERSRELNAQPYLRTQGRRGYARTWYKPKTIYTKDNNSAYHGIYINFPGDSTGGYRLRYYKHGVKDSVWITKMTNGSEKIESYLNGRMHGIWVGKDSAGNKSYYKKFNNGIPIDTAYDLWPNGNLMQMEIFQDGKLAKKSCFDDDGKTETECE